MRVPVYERGNSLSTVANVSGLRFRCPEPTIVCRRAAYTANRRWAWPASERSRRKVHEADLEAS